MYSRKQENRPGSRGRYSLALNTQGDVRGSWHWQGSGVKLKAKQNLYLYALFLKEFVGFRILGAVVIADRPIRRDPDLLA